MYLSESAEEILETIWTRAEKEDKSKFSLESIGMTKDDGAIKELTNFNLIILSENWVSLTTGGLSEAEYVIRRHRLAERLLVDVLDVEPALKLMTFSSNLKPDTIVNPLLSEYTQEPESQGDLSAR